MQNKGASQSNYSIMKMRVPVAALWLSSTVVTVVAGATAATISTSNVADTSYVFLQKFPLQFTFNSIFHTEVLVCPKDGFSTDDQQYLDDVVASLEDYQEMPLDWWSSRNASCMEFGYGGAACTQRCCGSPLSDQETHFPLNERRAVISNADTSQKSLFLYGTSGNLTGEHARHELCPDDAHDKCWSNWAGTDYNPLTNNCNTYTSTLLHCVFGLSDKKPNLGPSDMVTVKCSQCPIKKAAANNNKSSKRESSMEVPLVQS
jgi:hypothetical protein